MDEDAQAKERPGLTSVTSQTLGKGLSLRAMRAVQPVARGPSQRGVTSLRWGVRSSQGPKSANAS